METSYFLMNLKQYAIYPPRSQKTWSLSHAERKKVGKKEADMSGLPVNRVNHYMTEEDYC